MESKWLQMKQIKFWIFGILLITLIPITLADSSILREGSCNSSETCLFSVYIPNNTHIGACGYYNYSLCFPKEIGVYATNTDCGLEFLLSYYRQNNTHISLTPNYYNNSLCIRNYACQTSYSCSNEVFSAYQRDNTHIGDKGYYNLTVCCVPKNEQSGGGVYPGTGTNPYDLTSFCGYYANFSFEYNGTNITEESYSKFKNELEIKIGQGVTDEYLKDFILNYEEYCNITEVVKHKEEEKGNWWWLLLLLLLIPLVIYLDENEKLDKLKVLWFGLVKKKKKEP